MVDRGVYTLRGWLAFVAFLDFAQALRSYRDKDVFLGSYMCNRTDGAFNCTDATRRNRYFYLWLRFYAALNITSTILTHYSLIRLFLPPPPNSACPDDYSQASYHLLCSECFRSFDLRILHPPLAVSKIQWLQIYLFVMFPNPSYLI